MDFGALLFKRAEQKKIKRQKKILAVPEEVW